jgi:hypothetical protein
MDGIDPLAGKIDILRLVSELRPPPAVAST